MHATPTAPKLGFASSRDPERKLKIGYLTANTFSTPSRYFRVPLLRHANRDKFELYLYDARRDTSVDYWQYRELARVRRDVQGLSDTELLALIRRDEIDILVDLLGHHSYNRMRIFAERAAPVQVSYASYPGTTGLNEIDCFLSDMTTSPLGAEREYSEPVYRLPSGYLMYAPPDAPALSALPALSNGFITFGLFQRESKLNDTCWDAIASILLKAPRSRLLFHHSNPGLDVDGHSARLQILAALRSRDISGERVTFRGLRKLDSHLEVLAEADVALDTFPYNGQTTTCECLWMGVPVVNRMGNTHAGRIGGGLLHQVGLDDWVAHSDEEYIEIACRAGACVRVLTRLRSSLRDRLARSPLTDTITRTHESKPCTATSGAAG